jgi:hypothetical protein
MSLLTNLISYWKLDGNSNDAVGSNNGTDTDITYSSGNGKIVQGAGFNGTTSKIVIANESSFDFERTQAFSIACWVKYTSTSEMVFVSKEDSNSPYRGWSLEANGNAGKIGFYLINNVTGGGNAIMGETPLAYNDGNWHYVVGTYDGSGALSGMAVYIDGSPVTLTSIRDNLGANTILNNFSVNIGAQQTVNFMSGAIDEVGIWSRALTSGEVTSLWNGGNGLAYPLATDITINCPLGTISLGGQIPTTVGNIFISAVTGTINLLGYFGNLITIGWKELTKHASSWTDKSKNSSNWTDKSKNSSSWTNKSKN